MVKQPSKNFCSCPNIQPEQSYKSGIRHATLLTELHARYVPNY